MPTKTNDDQTHSLKRDQCKDCGAGFIVTDSTEECYQCKSKFCIYCKQKSLTKIKENLFCKKCVQNRINSQAEKEKIKQWLCWLIVVLLACAAGIAYRSLQNSKVDIVKLVKNLKNDYPSQDQLVWQTIYSVVNKNDPEVSSVILLYENNPQTSECLAEHVAETFSTAKGKPGQVHFEWTQDIDHGELLQDYLEKMNNSAAMVIKKLHQIPSQAARVFHSLCDTIVPVVDPAVYVFTLRYGEHHQSKNLISRAEGILKELWKDLPENELHPLLSRVVTHVLEVKPEAKPPC